MHVPPKIVELKNQFLYVIEGLANEFQAKAILCSLVCDLLEYAPIAGWTDSRGWCTAAEACPGLDPELREKIRGIRKNGSDRVAQAKQRDLDMANELEALEALAEDLVGWAEQAGLGLVAEASGIKGARLVGLIEVAREAIQAVEDRRKAEHVANITEAPSSRDHADLLLNKALASGVRSK